MNSLQIAQPFVTERAVLLSFYSILVVIFGAQVYIRTRKSKSREPAFDPKNANSVNQCLGAVSALFSVIAWIDNHQVFGIGAPAIYEFAWTACWSTLVAAFVINASIAIHAMIISRCFGNHNNCKSQSNPTDNPRTPYDIWFWVCLLYPWIVSVIVTIVQDVIDRTWPFVIWSLSSATVLLVTSLRIVFLRRKISIQLTKLEQSDVDVNNTPNKVLARWKRFTQMGVVGAVFTALIAIAHAYVLFAGEPNRPLSHSDPSEYTTKHSIVMIAALINASILLAMLWFSWETPRFLNGEKSGGNHADNQKNTLSETDDIAP